MPEKPKRFIVLDGVRGAAAIVVFIFHISKSRIFPHGYLAVDLFFALSGFVLMHVYGKRLVSGMSAGFFAIRRFIRLYPMYFLGLIFGGLAHRSEPGLAMSLLYGAVFIPHTRGNLYPLNAVSWSLVAEIFINVVFGWMMIMRVPIYYMLVAVSCVVVGILISTHHLADINGGWTAGSWSSGPIRAGFSFPLGAILYRQSKRAFSVNGWWVIAAVLLSLSISNSFAHAMGPPTGHGGLTSLVIIVFSNSAILLFGASATAGRRSLLFFEWLGAISYALYATQGPLLHFIGKYGDTSEGWTCALTIGLGVSIAHLLTFYVEPPIRRWLSQCFAISTPALPSKISVFTDK